MGYYALPLDLDVYNSPNTQGYDGPWTYSDHNGDGKLDYAYNQMGKPIYSMTDGVVVFNGNYKPPDEAITAIHIKTRDTILNRYIIFRYMHGNFDKTLTTVKRGQQIGTVSNHDKSNLIHLHIDIQNEDGSFVYGTMNNRKWIDAKTNKNYDISNKVDMTKINLWTSTHGSHYGIGYNWLICAQTPEWKDSPEEPEGGITIDKTVYDNNPHWENDNQDGVTAYYTRTMKDSFLGPVPETWEIYQSNACRGFRAAVSIVMHEYASFGPFISQVWAKILRAVIIGYSLFHPNNTSTLDEWLYNVMNDHDSWVKDYNYNSPDGHWCSKENLELMFGNEALPFLKAYYYNLKYPNIYGSELSSKATGSTQPNALENIIKAAYKIMNGACIAANGYWSIASGAYFMVNWDPDTGKDEGKVPDPSGTQYSGHLVGMRGTSGEGGGTIDRCYTEYLE